VSTWKFEFFLLKSENIWLLPSAFSYEILMPFVICGYRKFIYTPSHLRAPEDVLKVNSPTGVVSEI
jgi:hypothetical protein